jgi:cyclopropane-fatty-acyl-phospholipid synthase
LSNTNEMANRDQIEATYNYMDPLFRASLGNNPDITAAMFNGDYSKSLADAQRDKHAYILQEIAFRLGFRVLDIGCGWGGFLTTVREKGGDGIGLTLSSTQVKACTSSGLNVYLGDWKELDVTTFGSVDCIVSVGAFEHFCSEDEYLAGKQEAIYAKFFHLCGALLPKGGRLYIQTMTWGTQVPNPDDITLDHPRGSNEYLLATIRKFYPGSWLPSGLDQVTRTAAPFFNVISTVNGREDYIETLSRWGGSLLTFHPKKLLAAIQTFPYLFRDPDFVHRLRMLAGNYQLECFKREIMDHYRIAFERL